jgi:chemotaxis protein histidine kinase CheA
VKDDDLNRALHRAFADDLGHRADRVEAFLHELGRAPDDARRNELVDALALEAHNLKGTALTLGLGDVEQLADGLETLAARIGRGEAAAGHDVAVTVTAALRSFAAESSRAAEAESRSRT